MTKSIGLIGARGYTGEELRRLVSAHPALELSFASSRSAAGTTLDDGTTLVSVSPEDIARRTPVDIYVLALANGDSEPYVRAIDDAFGDDALIVDLSADHRFDDSWTYGLPEHDDDGALQHATRIANPGCYATAMQLAARPLLPDIAVAPVFFGVSGYSGAGSTPSPRNDPARLKDGILPYALTNHIHEREVAHRLGRPIRFAPHVAPFFRGLSVTALFELRAPTDTKTVLRRYRDAYAAAPVVTVHAGDVPLLSEICGTPGAAIGSITATGTSVAAVVVLDNLLKGAAAQAIQNITIAMGIGDVASPQPVAALRDVRP